MNKITNNVLAVVTALATIVPTAANSAVYLVTYTGTAVDYMTGAAKGAFTATTTFDTSITSVFGSGSVGDAQYKYYNSTSPVVVSINGGTETVSTNKHLYYLSDAPDGSSNSDQFNMSAFSGFGNSMNFNVSLSSVTLNSTNFPSSLSASGIYGALFTYNTDNSVKQFYSLLGVVTVTNTAVPEPATWSMMILGFGAIGGAMRRKAARERSHSSRSVAA